MDHLFHFVIPGTPENAAFHFIVSSWQTVVLTVRHALTIARKRLRLEK